MKAFPSDNDHLKPRRLGLGPTKDRVLGKAQPTIKEAYHAILS